MKTTFLLPLLTLTLCLGCGSASDLKDPESRLSVSAPLSCTIRTYTGHYLTAVGGGGRLTDVIHTDATAVGSWERFTLIDSGDGSAFINYGIKTKSGHYLTAVSGGGRITDVIHTDAVLLRDWEKFQLHSLGGGVYAIRTFKGYYLTAVGGGGRITDTIHSDATAVGNWEKFRLTCTTL